MKLARGQLKRRRLLCTHLVEPRKLLPPGTVDVVSKRDWGGVEIKVVNTKTLGANCW